MRKLKKDQLSTCFPTSSTLLFTTHFVTIWVNIIVVFGFVDFLLFFPKGGTMPRPVSGENYHELMDVVSRNERAVNFSQSEPRKSNC